MFHRIVTLGLALAVTAVAPSVSAQEKGISIDLSAAGDTGGACRMSFVATNNTKQTIAKAVYEVVLFNTDGAVAQMTLLDFQELPAGRPRVRQFQFSGLPCADVPRILINGAATCDGAPEGTCIDALHLSTRTGTELVG